VREEGRWLLGATGGYLLGFAVAAGLVGRLAELGWDRHVGGAVVAMALGNLVVYAVGVPWLIAATGYDAATALDKGVARSCSGSAEARPGRDPVPRRLVGRRPPAGRALGVEPGPTMPVPRRGGRSSEDLQPETREAACQLAGQVAFGERVEVGDERRRRAEAEAVVTQVLAERLPEQGTAIRTRTVFSRFAPWT